MSGIPKVRTTRGRSQGWAGACIPCCRACLCVLEPKAPSVLLGSVCPGSSLNSGISLDPGEPMYLEGCHNLGKVHKTPPFRTGQEMRAIESIKAFSVTSLECPRCTPLTDLFKVRCPVRSENQVLQSWAGKMPWIEEVQRQDA